MLSSRNLLFKRIYIPKMNLFVLNIKAMISQSVKVIIFLKNLYLSVYDEEILYYL